MIILNLIKLKYLKTVIRKIRFKIFPQNTDYQREKSSAWIKEVVEPLDLFCQTRSAELWTEAEYVASSISDEGHARLMHINADLGGGGCYSLLYFLVAYLKPTVVVETGVAAGFSSYAILKAMDNNEHGTLFSSDFPYLRLKDPEKYVGLLVPNELRERWKLFIEGDQRNLKKILELTTSIDLFHYDSDKSYSGRDEAYQAVSASLSKNAVLVFDDIQDNCHFMDFVESRDDQIKWHVFNFQNKYLGLVYGANSDLY